MARKKIWMPLGAVIVLVTVLVVALPLQSKVYEQIKIISVADAFNRQLLKDSIWHQWWPGRVITTGKNLVLEADGFSFEKKKNYLNGVEFQVVQNSFSIPATLSVVTDSTGYVVLSLHAVVDWPRHPVKRIQSYFLSVRLKDAFRHILSSQSKYFSSIKNLYDIDIEETTVQFEFYTTLTHYFSHPPSVAEQYALIGAVKQFIRKHHSVENGAPMLHVSQTGNNEYYTQVAIPVPTPLPDEGNIKSKQMLKGGNILKAQVKGGYRILANARQQMRNYMADHHKQPAAIPFETLITNRLEQPDETQWVTDVYFPIF
ncbi:MAG: GyrI-like domain-containing protein [Bacteroidetes bacterium]|nr:GyrI-like domain-containing protein [Bacteroidota bacterium]